MIAVTDVLVSGNCSDSHQNQFFGMSLYEDDMSPYVLGIFKYSPLQMGEEVVY